ncbi:MAG: metallophosphoesterase [Phycisphaerales bacterium]|nr:metallophosphoesterase [Phycisphaerales bacterium]
MPVFIGNPAFDYRSNVTLTARLTRRSFLALIVAGCTRVHPHRETAEPLSTTWAFLSDPHISGDRGAQVRGDCMAENLSRVVREVSARMPQHILFNGDLAYEIGESADYRAFSELTAPLRSQAEAVHLTLGNHDNRKQLLAGLRVDRSAVIAEKSVGVRLIGGHEWFFLDSLREVNEVQGSLGSNQIDWLAERLDNGSYPAVVCVHHNPDSSLWGLIDSKAFLETVLPRRRVKLVLCGHTHFYRYWETEGLHFVNLPAVGYRLFNPNASLGWISAVVAPDAVELEFRGVTGAEPEQGTRLRLAWR